MIYCALRRCFLIWLQWFDKFISYNDIASVSSVWFAVDYISCCTRQIHDCIASSRQIFRSIRLFDTFYDRIGIDHSRVMISRHDNVWLYVVQIIRHRCAFVYDYCWTDWLYICDCVVDISTSSSSTMICIFVDCAISRSRCRTVNSAWQIYRSIASQISRIVASRRLSVSCCCRSFHIADNVLLCCCCDRHCCINVGWLRCDCAVVSIFALCDMMYRTFASTVSTFDTLRCVLTTVYVSRYVVYNRCVASRSVTFGDIGTFRFVACACAFTDFVSSSHRRHVDAHRAYRRYIFTTSHTTSRYVTVT